MKLRIALLLSLTPVLLGAPAYSQKPARTTNGTPASAWQTIQVTGSFHPREEASFVAVGQHLYLLGGRGVQAVDIFDPKTNTWTPGAAPPMEIHHFQGVAWQGRIYVAGAMTGKYPTEAPISNILIYDTAADTWTTGPEIPAARRRGGAGAAILNGKLYLAAGIKNGHTDGWVNWFDSYDFATKKWSELLDAPRARDHFEAALIGGRLYLVGGRRSSYVTNETFNLTVPEVDVYNFATRTWTTLPATANLPTARAGAATTVVGTTFIVSGGESINQLVAHSEVEQFDTIKQQWHKLPSMTEGRHGTSVPLLNGTLYTAAGAGNRGGSPLVKSTESLKLR